VVTHRLWPNPTQPSPTHGWTRLMTISNYADVPLRNTHSLTHSWPDVTPLRWASLAGCAREGYLQYLQDGCHDIPPVFMVRHLGTSPTISPRPPTSLLGFFLHSANRHQLVVPRCRLNTYGCRAVVRRSGTRCLTSSEIRRIVLTKQFLKTIMFCLY